MNIKALDQPVLDSERVADHLIGEEIPLEVADDCVDFDNNLPVGAVAE